MKSIEKIVCQARDGKRGLWRRTICLTISVVDTRSMYRLWIFISYLSHVFDPSPQGYRGHHEPSKCMKRRLELLTVLRVVMASFFVGRRTGAFTRSCLSFARLRRSLPTVPNHKHGQYSSSKRNRIFECDAHFSRLGTFLPVKVMRILCSWAGAPPAAS